MLVSLDVVAYRSYCCPTAAKSLVFALRVLGFLQDLQEKRRADERTRTAYPCSLRVITQALQGCAQDCKCRISKPVTFLRLAECCTVLRSRWCQEAPDAEPRASRHGRLRGVEGDGEALEAAHGVVQVPLRLIDELVGVYLAGERPEHRLALYAGHGHADAAVDTEPEGQVS